MAAVAGAVPDRLPVAGLIAGPGVSLRIGKTPGQQRAIAKLFAPLLWQSPQGRALGTAVHRALHPTTTADK